MANGGFLEIGMKGFFKTYYYVNFYHIVYHPWHGSPCAYEMMYPNLPSSIRLKPFSTTYCFPIKYIKIKCLPTPMHRIIQLCYLQFDLCKISSYSINNLILHAIVPLIVCQQFQIKFQGKVVQMQCDLSHSFS